MALFVARMRLPRRPKWCFKQHKITESIAMSENFRPTFPAGAGICKRLVVPKIESRNGCVSQSFGHDVE
jgi:hypothetical protein